MKNNSGQTLIEVLLAVAVLIIFLVSMVSVVTHSIANSEFAKNKSLASKYVEEGLEKARAARDQSVDWQTFRTTYNGDVTISPAPPSPFVRTATFTDDELDPDNKKRIVVKVTWTDAKGDHVTQGITYLTRWD
jgi:Tfp pilus assembly protein PilV